MEEAVSVAKNARVLHAFLSLKRVNEFVAFGSFGLFEVSNNSNERLRGTYKNLLSAEDLTVGWNFLAILVRLMVARDSPRKRSGSRKFQDRLNIISI